MDGLPGDLIILFVVSKLVIYVLFTLSDQVRVGQFGLLGAGVLLFVHGVAYGSCPFYLFTNLLWLVCLYFVCDHELCTGVMKNTMLVILLSLVNS